MIIEDVGFVVDGAQVAARLSLPAGKDRVPAAFTAPGFAGVKEMLIPDYSRDLVGAGVASLAFDYPGFGDSAGSPRQQVDPAQQLRAFRAALEFLCTHPRVDTARIGVWGTSLSGGHTLVMATDPRVKAAAAIIPFIELKALPDPRMVALLSRDLVRGLLRRRRLTLPVAGHPGEVAAMNSDGAFEWAEGMAVGAPNYRNEVTVASLPKMLRWSTRKQVANITIPLLAVLAEEDSITPPELVRSALKDLDSVEYVSFPKSHFELFDEYGADLRKLVTEWLAKALGA